MLCPNTHPNESLEFRNRLLLLFFFHFLMKLVCRSGWIWFSQKQVMRFLRLIYESHTDNTQDGEFIKLYANSNIRNIFAKVGGEKCGPAVGGQALRSAVATESLWHFCSGHGHGMTIASCSYASHKHCMRSKLAPTHAKGWKPTDREGGRGEGEVACTCPFANPIRL